MSQGGKLVVAVDIDDVMFPFAVEFMKQYNHKNGTNHSNEDFQDYNFVEKLYRTNDPEEAEQYITEFIIHSRDIGLKLREEAAAGVKELEKYYELVVITSRHPDVYEATNEWLQDQLPNVFKGVHFIRGRSEKTSKPQICHELGAIALIDDHPNHLADCAKYGIRGLLFGDYYWNRDVELPENVERVKDWDEVLKVLS